ncbi:hypothetical protein [Natrinema ejinorense]|uniref:Uncharacterized protein n=1 Tax=Natrinema ejinorense TaxID=373386 RepID=A0A2A5QPH3_9EURY|nr:hypothetical protein [Natrinema ejinorense]PCR88633.1 hypothetical protein CP557_21610 [Natrinema ejinorense]
MSDSDQQSRTKRFRGRSPPDRDAEWEVSTVARRTTNQSGSRVCAATGETVPLSETHFFVTLRKPALGVLNDYEYDHLVVREDALEELDEWLVPEE